jgi:hypothetical protein
MIFCAFSCAASPRKEYLKIGTPAPFFEITDAVKRTSVSIKAERDSAARKVRPDTSLDAVETETTDVGGVSGNVVSVKSKKRPANGTTGEDKQHANKGVRSSHGSHNKNLTSWAIKEEEECVSDVVESSRL